MPQPREVALTVDAETDLTQILEYIAARNPLAAGVMSAKFDELFRRIGLAPGAGSRSERQPSMRRRILHNYVVYYERRAQ